jgi:ABC-2 type transport system ATP-binding protein
VDSLDLSVEAGEIFGFLGPNGAGKTTTLKLLVGLLRPTAGRGRILGRPLGDPRARARVGFLPEDPLFYDHLTVREFVQLCGELFGLGGPALADRVDAVLRRLGLDAHADTRLRRLSKGLAQRTGLAQALVNEPALLILDEPMSGLDPIGRSEVRRVLLEMKERGATILFSSHILPDVESLCDRVGVIRGGRLAAVGRVEDLLAPRTRTYEVVAAVPAGRNAGLSGAYPVSVRASGDRLFIDVREADAVGPVLARLLASGARVESVTPRRESLEDYFLREVAAGPDAGGADRDPGDASEAGGAPAARRRDVAS